MANAVPTEHRNFDPATVRYVHAIAIKYVGASDAAWDVTQDALLRAYVYRDSFRGDSAYTTWLYRVVATTALMHLRSNKRRMREEPSSTNLDDRPTVLDTTASSAPDPEQLASDREQLAIIGQRLAQMGAKYNDVFVQRYRDGFTETEIADATGTSLPTIKTRAHRALVAVRRSVAA